MGYPQAITISVIVICLTFVIFKVIDVLVYKRR